MMKQKLLYRWVTLLLVPALIADPALAIAFHDAQTYALCVRNNIFVEQALAEPVAAMPRPNNPTDSALLVTHLAEIPTTPPAAAANMVSAIAMGHGRNTLRALMERRDISDAEINARIGYRIEAIEDQLKTQGAVHYGREYWEYIPSPYNIIREAVDALRLGPKDIFYDLGGGYGQLALYAAVATTVNWAKALDLVRERMEEAERIAVLHRVGNVEFITGDARTAKFSDGTAFFLFDPFRQHTLNAVLSTLREIAADHPIRIAAWGPFTAYLQSLDWLRRDYEITRDCYDGLAVFESYVTTAEPKRSPAAFVGEKIFYSQALAPADVGGQFGPRTLAEDGKDKIVIHTLSANAPSAARANFIFDVVEGKGFRFLEERVSYPLDPVPSLSLENEERIDELNHLLTEVNSYQPPPGESKVPHISGTFMAGDLKRLARVFIHASVIRPGDRILDLGSGEGGVLALAADMFSALGDGAESDYVRLERSQHLIKLMEQRGYDAAQRMRFINENYTQLDWSSYDVIYYFTYGADYPIESEIIEKIKSQLKFGGRFVLLGLPGKRMGRLYSNTYPDIRPLLNSGEFELQNFPDASILVLTRKSRQNTFNRAHGEHAAVAIPAGKLAAMIPNHGLQGLLEPLAAALKEKSPVIWAKGRWLTLPLGSRQNILLISDVGGVLKIIYVDHPLRAYQILYRHPGIVIQSRAVVPKNAPWQTDFKDDNALLENISIRPGKDYASSFVLSMHASNSANLLRAVSMGNFDLPEAISFSARSGDKELMLGKEIGEALAARREFEAEQRQEEIHRQREEAKKRLPGNSYPSIFTFPFSWTPLQRILRDYAIHWPILLDPTHRIQTSAVNPLLPAIRDTRRPVNDRAVMALRYLAVHEWFKYLTGVSVHIAETFAEYMPASARSFYRRMFLTPRVNYSDLLTHLHIPTFMVTVFENNKAVDTDKYPKHGARVDILHKGETLEKPAETSKSIKVKVRFTGQVYDYFANLLRVSLPDNFKPIAYDVTLSAEHAIVESALLAFIDTEVVEGIKLFQNIGAHLDKLKIVRKWSFSNEEKVDRFTQLNSGDSLVILLRQRPRGRRRIPAAIRGAV